MFGPGPGGCDGRNTILEAGDIRITKSVASFGNTSFLIANITSLAVTSKPSSSVAQQLATAVLLVGTTFAALYSWTVAGVFFIVGFVVVGTLIALGVLRSEAEFTLMFKTSSGDVQALKSKDGELVTKVKQAIETAFQTK